MILIFIIIATVAILLRLIRQRQKKLNGIPATNV